MKRAGRESRWREKNKDARRHQKTFTYLPGDPSTARHAVARSYPKTLPGEERKTHSRDGNRGWAARDGRPRERLP